MVGFYSSIIFIGIILIVVSLILILFDKKEAYDTELRMDEKMSELLRIINDAEVMVDELNKFSDYVVTQIEEKSNEMDSKINEAEKVIETLRNEMASIDNLQKESTDNGSSVDISNVSIKSHSVNTSETEIEKVEDNVVELGKKSMDDIYIVQKTRDNVIPINSKHNEVIMLAKNGLSETEIARKLNIGKGEIQLILGVNK